MLPMKGSNAHRGSVSVEIVVEVARKCLKIICDKKHNILLGKVLMWPF